jgi:hypothetical protein
MAQLNIEPTAPQFVGDQHINRKRHVWAVIKDDLAKCVICGAITKTPTVNDVATKYAKLNDYERSLCPFEGK